MAKEYAVWHGTEIYVDMDQANWYNTYSAAFDAAEKAAEELPEGERMCLGIFEGGDMADFPLELRNENGIVEQWQNGTHYWL